MNEKKVNIAVGIMVILLFCLATPSMVKASTTLEQLNQAQEEKEKAEEELNAQEDAIDGLEDKKDGLNYQLQQFNLELVEISGNISELEEKIRVKQAEIVQTQYELMEAIEIEEIQYESMKKRIQFMYEQGNQVFSDLLFEANGFGDMLNKVDYIEQISAYENEQLRLYQQTKNDIMEFEAVLQGQKEEINNLHDDAVDEQNKFADLVGVTKNNLNATATEIAQAEVEAEALEEKIKEQEGTIAELRKQYEAELALSNQAANSAWRDISEVAFAEGDRYLLASIIYCEAGGESYEGQLAVGAVVMNRLLSSRYPDTLTGVIYQYKQFSPVLSGRLAIAMAESKATASCYQAADQAMQGYTNVDSCLYFRTPIDGVVPTYQIGGHIFY
ncbi:MAG: cell wall hydrolase [Eubacteriales bacterium]